MLDPATRVPLTRSAGMPSDSTILKTRARMTGPPTTRAMKMVRRDHNISPNDRSNTRRAAAKSDGGGTRERAVTAAPGT